MSFIKNISCIKSGAYVIWQPYEKASSNQQKMKKEIEM